MNQEAVDLIAVAGGPVALAARLQLPSDGAAQRVSNWRVRGIPSKVQLEHIDVLAELRARVASAATPALPAEQEPRDAA